jgi:hypothetical protein
MQEPADVLIVGAGASGGVAVLRLARAGYRVVCLEQGEWTDPADYPGAGPDWELLARKQWSSSPNLRGRAGDYPIDLAASDMQLGNFNGVGGGTVLYSAVWPRLLPSDFACRSNFGIADDWPLDFEPWLTLPGAQTFAWDPSIHLIAHALGVEIEEMRELYERVPSDRRLEVASGVIEPGTCGAVRVRTIGVVNGRDAITIERADAPAPRLRLTVAPDRQRPASRSTSGATVSKEAPGVMT